MKPMRNTEADIGNLRHSEARNARHSSRHREEGRRLGFLATKAAVALVLF